MIIAEHFNYKYTMINISDIDNWSFENNVNVGENINSRIISEAS